MANLKLNNVVVVAESSGVATLQNIDIKTGTIKADDGTAAITIADSSGAVSLAGTLGVTGAATLSSTLGVTGATTLSSTLAVTGTTTLTGATTITGDLTVNGTTTTVNSTTLTVDDKNIEMGSVASPTDLTADGGGITLKGTTDKTILWENDTNSWDFNQDIATSTTTKVKQKGVFMENSFHQSWILGG